MDRLHITSAGLPWTEPETSGGPQDDDLVNSRVAFSTLCSSPASKGSFCPAVEAATTAGWSARGLLILSRSVIAFLKRRSL